MIYLFKSLLATISLNRTPEIKKTKQEKGQGPFLMPFALADFFLNKLMWMSLLSLLCGMPLCIWEIYTISFYKS